MSKSSITIGRKRLLANPHPGEILLADFLKPMGLSQNALARALHVPPRRINEIVLGKRDVTADTDLRLARYFGLSEGLFLSLQMDYDLLNAAARSNTICNQFPHAQHSQKSGSHVQTRTPDRETVVRPDQRRGQ